MDRSIPVIGQLGSLERCADVIATYVEKHGAVSNLELHELSYLVLGAIAREPRPDVAAAMILTALIAVRDAPDAVRGDSKTITESRHPELVAKGS